MLLAQNDWCEELIHTLDLEEMPAKRQKVFFNDNFAIIQEENENLKKELEIERSERREANSDLREAKNEIKELKAEIKQLKTALQNFIPLPY